MDTSEQYIKMCEKAKEIQKSHKWELGSFYYMPKDGECAIYSSKCREYSRFATISDGEEFALDDPFIWLPRQDQLQEMLVFPSGTFKDNFWTALFCLNEWGFESKFIDYIPMSMEQLWLAFVMKGKYNKVWTGEEWITS